MTPQTLVAHLNAYEWNYPIGRDAQDNVIRWKTLVSADRVPTEAIIMGILEVPPGAKMNTHRHVQPEVYFVYEGSGEVYIDEVIHPVNAGSVVFVCGNSLHGVRNRTGETLKLMWVFADHSFAEVKYRGEPVDF